MSSQPVIAIQYVKENFKAQNKPRPGRDDLKTDRFGTRSSITPDNYDGG